ncbi:hypothetical protein K1719_018589 [Acacia pycnantha]|nr:hypothetical protein K1719_018589 [Acacia pycnantha]
MSPLLPLFQIAEAGKFRRRKCRESVRGINGVVLDLYDPRGKSLSGGERERYMQKGKMKEQAITVDNDDGSDEEESEYGIMNEFTTAKLQSAPPPPSPPIDIPFISLISVIAFRFTLLFFTR